MRTPPNSERRTERVRLETDRHVVVGTVTLPADGYQSRLSDAINRPDVAFLALTDVEVAPLAGGDPERHPFLLLGKAHVRIAHPLG